MGFTRPFLQRALVAVTAPALLAAGLLASTPATADALPTPASATALPTVQIDGVVWTQIVVGDTVYAGGSFSTVRAAGAAAGTGVSQPYLVAYNIQTGARISSFAPSLNGQVRGLAVSADGSRIYAVGDFTTASGQQHDRIVALDPTTGAAEPDFTAQVNGSALAVAVTTSTVYVGGAFTSADGVSRKKAAAFDATGAITPWAPQVDDNSVRALAISPDATKVVMGGSFTTVAGVSTPGIGAVTASTGAQMQWLANSTVQDSGLNSAIYSLSTKGSIVYATGYSWAGNGGTGNLEGAVAMNWSDGSIEWIENCNGDTYSSFPYAGALYTASHAHDCVNIGGFTETDPETYHRALAFSLSATHTILPTSGWFANLPAPTLLDWYPDLTPGTYTGLSQAAWSVTAGSGYVVYGGEFTKVNGTLQQGLTRFQSVDDSTQPVPVDTTTPTPTPTPTSTPTTGPTSGTTPPAGTTATTKPAKATGVSVAALGTTQVAVRWSATKGATQYKVVVKSGSHVVKTKVVKVTTTSKRLAVITGLKKSHTYRVTVQATNAKGSGATSSVSQVKTKAKGKTVSATKTPSTVKTPKASAGKTSVTAKWTGASTKGALGVSKYQIRIVLHGKTVKVVTVSSHARSKVLAALKRHTTYTVSVRAANWAGWGHWSRGRTLNTR